MSRDTYPAIDRFLDAVRSASVATSGDLYTSASVLDATVPDWRFTTTGDDAIRTEYGRWFAHPARIEELTRQPTPTGEVVEYTVTWVEDGVPHAGRHAHVLVVDPATDRIISDHVWCGGRWPAGLLAEMGASTDAHDVDAAEVAG